MKQRWKLTIEYNGEGYCGWQRQPEGIKTVQAAVEKALYAFCQQNITLYVAGRTDAGVHAHGQIAHFDLDYGDREINGYIIEKALNAHLRREHISILQAEQVADDFHARFNAHNKLYTYRVINRQSGLSLDLKRAWHIRRKLNIDAMRDASSVLLGHHDFSTFRAAECQSKSPFKTLDSIEIQTREYDACGGVEVLFHLQAQSFLHHQVRNIVGTLSLVGQDKWAKIDLKNALEAKNRAAGGPTAPADGLYLVKIDY